ncbi:MAG: response regulator [Candidatus Desantisbacteria bacterium]
MKRILIADDNKLIRLALREALQGEGVGIFETDNGKEALQWFESCHPDLLIMDIKMPQMDGMEVLKRIRLIDEQVPIIIATAYKGMENDPEIALGNVSAFMTKPIDIGVLRLKVKEILGRKGKGK